MLSCWAAVYSNVYDIRNQSLAQQALKLTNSWMENKIENAWMCDEHNVFLVSRPPAGNCMQL